MNIKQTYLSRISNTLFLIGIVFFINLIWINYYLKNINKSIISSIIISLTFCLVFFIIKKIATNKKRNKINASSNIENLKKQLLFGKDNKIITHLCKAFEIIDLTSINNNHFVDNKNKIDYYFMFFTPIINENDMVYIIKNAEYKNIKVFCIDTPQFPSITNYTIEVFDTKKISKKLKEQNIFIDNYINIQKKPKLSINDVMCVVFNRKQSKQYFLFGIMLIFTSLFSPYIIYYNIVGTLLLLLSLYSRFNKKFN